MIIKKILLFLVLSSPLSILPKVDIIIFSFDRALQLYALLESIKVYTNGIDNINIIYRTSNAQHEKAYGEVFEDVKKQLKIFPLKENFGKSSDFRSLLINTVSNSKNLYLLFAVDDIIIKDFINFNECCEVFEKLSLNKIPVHGFYLRLGKNITKNYGGKKNSSLPPNMRQINEKILMWQFSEGKGDWKYPNTVDMTLYKKEDIEQEINQMNFQSPNTFEGTWSTMANFSKFGLCYKNSKIVNIPANRVQNDFNNEHMNSFSTEELLLKFQQGLKIDIHNFYLIDNDCPHFDQIYNFIKR